MLLMPPEDRRWHALLLLTVVFPCVVHTLIFAHSRYHLPIMPIMILYAAAALTNWKSIWQRRRTKTFWLGAAICTMLALGWVRELVVVDMKHLSGLG